MKQSLSDGQSTKRKGTDMTHVDIDYSSLQGVAKQEAALWDIKNWIGIEKFEHLTAELRKFDRDEMPLERMAMLMTIAGISGYPIRAWHEYIFDGK